VDNLFRSRLLSKNIKIQLYITLIRPMVMYGSQCWTLRKIEELRLRAFERKIQRRRYGPYLDPQTGEWRKRHNDELIDLYNRRGVANEIKRIRLEWAGHMWRKPEALVNTVLQEDPRGKRPLGRPWLRWEDCVKRDAADFHADWQTLAEKRDG